MRARFALIGSLIVLCSASAYSQMADVIVAADGSGDVRTVNEAIARVPEFNRKRYTIAIRPGTYVEQINIPVTKPFVTLIGDPAGGTKLSFDINSARAGTTSAAYAFYVGGHDFRAENITFENAYDYKPGQVGSQAVAVLAEADRIVFRKCRFLGWQDTLYAKNGRQYYVDSYIEGHVDFIFGQAAAVFENCEIRSKGNGYIAAPMRFADNERSGFVFFRSKLTANDGVTGVFLARPWRAFGRTVFIETEMGAHIRPEGWNNWGKTENESTAFFAESGSTGPGSDPSKRVAWARKLDKKAFDLFAPQAFLRGSDGWDPKGSDDRFAETVRPDWSLVTWSGALRQAPLWYQTDEAARIADQVILYQKTNGGWEKNVDMARVLTETERAKVRAAKDDIAESTIDNNATHTQLAYLAKTISASLQKSTPPANHPKHMESFNKGLDYILSMPYENGGFPQFFPLRKDYTRHITFNDGAMIGVLEVLRDIDEMKPDYRFVDDARRAKSAAAVAKAIPLILKLQVVEKGVRTVWVQQYDEVNLEPAWARKFEPPCLTSSESVGIVRFLMGIKKPSAEVVDAIESAVKWLRANQINGYRWESVKGDRQLVKDEKAGPLWARFYEFGTARPIFLGRDAVIRYDVKEIESERRNGYAWYGNWPQSLLEKDYPKWKRSLSKK